MTPSARRILPWIVAAVFAVAFLAAVFGNRKGTASTRPSPAAPEASTPARERKILYWVDPMHPAYKSDKPGIAPDCGMELVPVYDNGSMGGPGGNPSGSAPGTVHIKAEKQQVIGVRVQAVETRPSSHSLRILGRVAVDER